MHNIKECSEMFLNDSRMFQDSFSISNTYKKVTPMMFLRRHSSCRTLGRFRWDTLNAEDGIALNPVQRSPEYTARVDGRWSYVY
jgi:hypothetical protein